MYWLVIKLQKFSILILVFCLISCTLEKHQDDKPQLFLLGLDGFNWHVAYPLVKQGLLPNIEKLMEKGMASPFKTFIPTVSPIIWTSIATGKTPEKHRIYWRTVSKNRDTNEFKYAMSSQERACKAFWNILSEAKLGVDLVNWWCSWPAEEINGYDVTFSYMQYDETDRGVYPPEFLDELNKQPFNIGVPPEMKPWLDKAKENLPPKIDDKEKVRWGQQKDSHVDAPSDAEITRLIHERYKVVYDNSVQDNKARTISEYMLDKKNRPDLFATYYWYVDLLQHHYWKYMEPELFNVDEREMKVLNGAIQQYFMYMDSVLEGMICRMKPNGHIIVCSDHGFHQSQMEKTISEHIYIDDVIQKTETVKKNPDIKVKVHDQIRTIRTLRIEFPESFKEEYKKTYKEKLAEELKNIKGINSGVPLFEQVIIMEKDTKITYEGRFVFLVDPADISLIINIYMDNNEIIRVGGEKIPVKIYVPYTPQPSGNHPDAPEGFFLAYGPNFEHGIPTAKPSVFDITPTILYFFDLPIAEDMDGLPYLPLFKDKFKNAHPVRTIKTYETGENKKHEKHETSDHDKNMIKQLKSLGYIQ